MKNEINAVLENMTTTIPEPEDYTGEDGLLYCGKCRKPKEAYFAPDKAAIFGRDRHPAECDCQRTAREEREAAEKRRRHLDTVEELKRRGFTDPTMRDWTFENDNGRNPQTGLARRYVEHWEDMRTDNIGCLFWGGVGTGKSYLAGCIANALMEKEIPVRLAIARDEAFSFFYKENEELLQEEESSIITMTDENGQDVDFEYLDCIEYEGKEYLVLIPAEEDANEIVILEIEPVDEENENYIGVEDEAVLEAVFGIFKEKYADVLTFEE